MEERDPRVAGVVAAVRRRWGNRSARWGNEVAPIVGRACFGLPPLDALLGGVPRGRVSEFLGAPTSGMTTLALRLVAHAQAHDELVAWLDLAGVFDAEYAAFCGIDLDALLLARPVTASDALELLRALVEQRVIGVLVVDQLGMLQARPDHAHLLDHALPRLLPPLAQSPTALVALSTAPYAPDMVRAIAYRGSLLAHAASLRLHVARAGWADDPLRLGCYARVLVLKDKLAGVVGEATVAFDFEAREVGR